MSADLRRAALLHVARRQNAVAGHAVATHRGQRTTHAAGAARADRRTMQRRFPRPAESLLTILALLVGVVVGAILGLTLLLASFGAALSLLGPVSWSDLPRLVQSQTWRDNVGLAILSLALLLVPYLLFGLPCALALELARRVRGLMAWRRCRGLLQEPGAQSLRPLLALLVYDHCRARGSRSLKVERIVDRAAAAAGAARGTVALALLLLIYVRLSLLVFSYGLQVTLCVIVLSWGWAIFLGLYVLIWLLRARRFGQVAAATIAALFDGRSLFDVLRPSRDAAVNGLDSLRWRAPRRHTGHARSGRTAWSGSERSAG